MENWKNSIVDSFTGLSRSEKMMMPFAMLGMLTLGSLAWKVAAGFTKYFLLPRRNIYARYGKGWAIVTGASDGIGKQYAFELAKEGFSIILVGRDEQKLNAVAKEIQDTLQNKVFTQIVVFDFATLATPESVQVLESKLDAVVSGK